MAFGTFVAPVRSLWMGEQRLQIYLKCVRNLSLAGTYFFLTAAFRLWAENPRNVLGRFGLCCCRSACIGIAIDTAIGAAIGGHLDPIDPTVDQWSRVNNRNRSKKI